VEIRQCTATNRNQAESCKALQWRSERRLQMQGYTNQNEMTVMELNLQCNYFTRVERHFRSKNNWPGDNF